MAKGKKSKRRSHKKDPNKPKRSMSSFMFFANEKRAEVRAANPELKITEIGKALGAMWKSLTPDEKRRYEELSQRDTERYQKAMEGYTAPESDSDDSDDESPKKRRRRKQKKDPNKPKRSMSSFMFFANDKRPEVRAKFPDMKVTEIGKRLAELWRTISPEEKRRYEDMAARDKERYKSAMEHYTPPSKVENEESSSSESESSDSDSS